MELNKLKELCQPRKLTQRFLYMLKNSFNSAALYMTSDTIKSTYNYRFCTSSKKIYRKLTVIFYWTKTWVFICKKYQRVLPILVAQKKLKEVTNEFDFDFNDLHLFLLEHASSSGLLDNDSAFFPRFRQSVHILLLNIVKQIDLSYFYTETKMHLVGTQRKLNNKLNKNEKEFLQHLRQNINDSAFQ